MGAKMTAIRWTVEETVGKRTGLLDPPLQRKAEIPYRDYLFRETNAVRSRGKIRVRQRVCPQI
jgi:hypothetical protein